MEYVRLGRTGLQVSRLCLGCLNYGTPGPEFPWTMPEEDSLPFIKAAIDQGINFFDTSNAYTFGSSEEILGKALKDFGRREEVVIATKVRKRMRPGPNGTGLSRKAIFQEVDASLRRLQTDYIDLYQIHRWDPETPIEETLEALHDTVKSGKVRYIGGSTMEAWKFVKAIYTSRLHGWTEFVSMQNHYNLLYREEEREMIGFCIDQGIGVIPWSPMARGVLARPWATSQTMRSGTDTGFRLYRGHEDSHRTIVERVAAIAEQRGVPQSQVALAWVLAKPGITAPIFGSSKPYHLTDAVGALAIKLTDDEIRLLEEPYVPHAAMDTVGRGV